MCGICGFMGFEQPELLNSMMDALTHRGPDDAGAFHEPSIAMGHRRLSVIDIAGGHQPMSSPDGRYVIVFNGEIYNFRKLRETLAGQGIRVQTNSDTEVLLLMYQLYGAQALEKLNGMFALAIYDRNRQELFLARDRVGIKPLYYVHYRERFLFASETKALLKDPGWPRSINSQAIADYLTFRYVPGERGILNEVQRVPAGHYMLYRNGRGEIHRYWSPPHRSNGPARSEQEYMEEFAELLEASVRRRLISDVPFGAYLSGGVDSSVIVALMSQIVSEPVKTFSVGFDYEHDELEKASATAQRLGCDHHAVECRANDVSLLGEVVYHSDEPMGDPISIPMFKLAQEAKKHVTVILTGEGADELLGGYLFHKVIWWAHLYQRAVPAALRSRIVNPLLHVTPAVVLNLAFKYPAFLGKRGKLKAVDYSRLIGKGSLNDEYSHLISLFDNRDQCGLFADDFQSSLNGTLPDSQPKTIEHSAYFNEMLRLQFDHWLPDNMLLRQDKMSMASGIEGRVPFLDHELVEFSFSLPRTMRLRGLTGKHALRKFAEGILPNETAKRRKMPFYVPVEEYFRQPAFVALMEELLSDTSVRRRGIFNPEAIRRLRESMQENEFVLVKQVYSLMTLELWFRTFVDSPGVLQA